MPEQRPQTRDALAADLRRLGVTAGQSVLVHASLRSLGYVLGGATTVAHAILDAIGPGGTLLAPAYTPENRDPSRWTDPAPAPERWPLIRAELPAFDPALSPSAGVGAVAERVRTWPGAYRSAHPQTSFAAIGARAAEATAKHDLDSPLGPLSPLGWLESVSGQALLIGVGFDRYPAFHLAEYRLPEPPIRSHGCALMTATGRRWVTFDSVDLRADDFGALGASFEAEADQIRRGPIGAAVRM